MFVCAVIVSELCGQTRGDSDHAVGELVVVEVDAVIGGVLGVLVKIGNAGGVIAILVIFW